jgi:hypothetical protein
MLVHVCVALSWHVFAIQHGHMYDLYACLAKMVTPCLQNYDAALVSIFLFLFVFMSVH